MRRRAGWRQRTSAGSPQGRNRGRSTFPSDWRDRPVRALPSAQPKPRESRQVKNRGGGSPKWEKVAETLVPSASDVSQRVENSWKITERSLRALAYFTGSLTKATLLRPALEASASISAT